ncbi:Mfa1 family fimbria major subunit [uncultured Prevotella sp.]|uniref:Mfa1 family fimbria major subunit n=1 Tax=uncultured Prevotella sp. TaxID=159272 RepID=UPI00260024BC|nr:Mfa1 family fimbria major subunit [uncultured Prevotella sp.]
MRNVKNLFGMAVMATALVACSSNDDLASNGKDNVGKTGEAYASFTINLPTTSGTRVAGDPELNPGTAAEYEVKNGTILIFDKDGLYVTSAQLGTMNPWTPVKTDGVTTAAITTVKLSGVKVGGDYQALVLLNNDVDATTSKVTLPSTGTPYATWSAEASNVNAEKYASTDGIFMANAPKYTGTTTEPTTLVPIANVCASREEAQAKVATTVYVERGLAKVTMQNFTADGYTVAEGTYKGDKVEIKNWQLDVTNKSTFPVHQIGGTGYAAIWSTPRFYDGGNQSFKRVYWGVDPNYSGATLQNLTACKKAFTMIGKNDIKGKTGNDHPQYCLENTFDLANMMQGQTTRVVFKAVYTPSALVGTTEKTFYKIGNNTAIWTKDNLEKQIHTVAVTAMGITNADEQAKYVVKLDATDNNISGEAGQHLIKAENITYSGEAASSKVTPDVVNKINEKLGLSADAGIATYLDGVTYYIARIKHFNELTPWTAGKPYGTDNDKYLGRYGVLRNNWYDLSVTSISGLGYPDVPEVKPDVPDDENEQYINVEVKILDWAKRSQQIKL